MEPRVLQSRSDIAVAVEKIDGRGTEKDSPAVKGCGNMAERISVPPMGPATVGPSTAPAGALTTPSKPATATSAQLRKLLPPKILHGRHKRLPAMPP